MGRLNKIGLWLQDYPPGTLKEEPSCLKKTYISYQCLTIITIVGILLATVGTLSLLASQGNVPDLLRFLHAENIPMNSLKIAGIVGIAIGYPVVLVHSFLVACKAKYELPFSRLS